MRSAINIKPYLLSEATQRLADETGETLFGIVARCLLAVEEKTGVSIATMLTSKTPDREVSDAKHLAILLTYDETAQMGITNRSVCNMFGMQGKDTVMRAKKKAEQIKVFRDKYKAIKEEYDNTVLIEYDENIPF